MKEIKSWIKSGTVLLFLAFTFANLATTIADPDLWGYMAFGRLFWETGRFPYQDVFSYVPTLNPWIYHEWLTGVFFYPIYQTLGDPGLQFLKYCFGLATVGFTYLTARVRGADYWGAIFLQSIVVGFLTFGYSPVRAQVFTYFFFVITIYLLEITRLTGRWKHLWLLIPIQILWCNLHGGFLSGLGLVGIYIIGEAFSRRPFLPYVVILIFSMLATLINPYGLKYWQYLIRAISMPRAEITEWSSVYIAYQFGIFDKSELLYLLVIMILSALLVWWAKWRELTPGFALCLTLYLGLTHIRHTVFFALLMGAYLPVLLTTFFQKMKSDPEISAIVRRIGIKIPAVAVIFLTIFYSGKFIRENPLSLKLPSQSDKSNAISIYYPVGAVNHIKKHSLSGNLLTEFNWGEYLIWTLYPQCRVSLDGRYENVYAEDLSREYFDFLLGRDNWRQFLNKYPPGMILIYSQSKLCSLIQKEPKWRQVFHDAGCTLFVASHP